MALTILFNPFVFSRSSITVQFCELFPGTFASSTHVIEYVTVTDKLRSLTKKTATCAWCGKEIPVNRGRGRKRKYCGPSCKQRAYEQRTMLAGTSVDEDAVILNRNKVAEYRDRLYALRCAAVDIRTAADEGAKPDDLAPLCDELVELAQQLERLR